MKTKDLQKKLKEVTNDIPELVVHYKSATKDIYGINADVAKYTYEKFEERSEYLRMERVPLRLFAYGVLTLLQDWVAKKKFRQLPTNVFLGEWALKKFNNVEKSKWVDFHFSEDGKDAILHSELQVARYYIETASKKFVRFMDCVEDIRPLLHKDWLHMYDAGESRIWLISEAMVILEQEYGVRAQRYTDFVDSKVLNGK